MMRTTPLPFLATGGSIPPHVFVNVDVAAGTAAIATDLTSSEGITIGKTTVEAGEPISVMSVKDTRETTYIRCGATVTKGDLLCASAGGLAVTDVAGKVVALSSGVLGQLIDVISAEAY
jgi:hypothetical protein